MISLPEHGSMLQLSVLLLAPTQSAPPPCGVGFVQLRVRVRVPAPQVAEQLLQDDHCVNPPSTTACVKTLASFL